MADRRLELHESLKNATGLDSIFFQPPEKNDIRYPCIIYHLSDIQTDYADNTVYHLEKIYLLTLVDTDPDSIYLDKLIETFVKLRFVKFYVSDSLNHWILRLQY